jgi:hypothetical protein
MTIQQLVGRHSSGAITGQHLIVQCLLLLDPVNPDLVLAAIPQCLLDKFALFVDEYRPGYMITTHGALPTREQVAAAAKWLARAGRRVGV